MKFKTIFLFILPLLLVLAPALLFAQAGVEVTNAIKDTGRGFSAESLFRGLFGILVILGLGFVFSSNRKSINWKVVGIGLLIQLVVALAVLKVPTVQLIIEFMGKIFIKILESSNAGSEFLFKSLITSKVESGLINFAFQILPTIIFFSALTSVLFYYGIIQKIVFVFAWLLKKALKLSGPESLAASSNIFLGQTEAPFLIKEYLDKMNKSEMMLVMVAGMATIAGGVLAIYTGLLGGVDSATKLLFAKHLITASVMAAPGAVVMAKMLVPQTEPIVSDIKISKDKIGTNLLDAIANGTGQGLRLAVNVAAMLIAFIAGIYFLNFILGKIGDWTHLNNLIMGLTGGQYTKFSLQFALGYALAPLTWTLGVHAKDMAVVGQLLGEKVILNEMVAYISLKDLIAGGVFHDQKSIILSVYILCGFANFASVGIQVGGIGALAPSQRVTLSKLGFKALLGGALASLLSATLVGVIMG